MLEGLNPQKVFKYFEEICKIPHGSGNEKGLSDWLLNFGLSKGFETVQDEALNVIIRKPGTKGYEDKGEVILQGHMDMVCEKNKDTEFDFEKEPLKIYADGDFVKARGTTLGADNGIAVAMMLALLEAEDIEHPPLRAVITTMEEVGLNGAAALTKENLSGKYLINMDSENEGVFLASCAGGARCDFKLACGERELPKAGYKPLLIEVLGLTGGHSGMDIHKERGNSIALLSRILNETASYTDMFVASLSGGSKDNAIPREAECVVFVPGEDAEKVMKTVSDMDAVFRKELRAVDSGVKARVSAVETDFGVFSEDFSRKIVRLLTVLPTGVFAKDMQTGIVETSCNLGVVKTAEDGIEFTVSVRSSVESKKKFIISKLNTAADLVNAEFSVRAAYPGWAYDPDSRLREIFSETYKEITGKEAVVEAIHAGVECGIIKDKNPALDVISFGPSMSGAHTPEERLSISSVERSWNFLLEVLKKLD